MYVLILVAALPHLTESRVAVAGLRRVRTLEHLDSDSYLVPREHERCTRGTRKTEYSQLTEIAKDSLEEGVGFELTYCQPLCRC
jgi:hypothetical protein